MTDLMAATTRLVQALKAENAALTALDLPRAGQMLAEKVAAFRDFTDSLALHDPQARPDIEAFGDVIALDRSAPAALRALANRLRVAAVENRRLLERAITGQTRVLGTLTQAAAAANPGTRYDRGGAMMEAPREAWALTSHA